MFFEVFLMVFRVVSCFFFISMVFHGLWLPRSFKVASWFFAGFHRFQDSFTLLHGFFCLSLFSFFCQVTFMAFHYYGLFHDFSRYFHGHVLFRDFSR